MGHVNDAASLRNIPKQNDIALAETLRNKRFGNTLIKLLIVGFGKALFSIWVMGISMLMGEPPMLTDFLMQSTKDPFQRAVGFCTIVIHFQTIAPVLIPRIFVLVLRQTIYMMPSIKEPCVTDGEVAKIGKVEILIGTPHNQPSR
jgi:hypothetical protein